MTRRLVRLKDALEIRPEARSTFFREIQEGRLPPPIKASARVTAFLEDELFLSVDLDVAGARQPDGAHFWQWVRARAQADESSTGEPPAAWYWARARAIAELHGWGCEEHTSAHYAQKAAI